MLWKSLFTGAIVGCLGTCYAGSSLWNMASGNIYYSDRENEIKQPESNVVIAVDSDVSASTTPGSDKAQGPTATGGAPSGTGQNPQQVQSQSLPSAGAGGAKVIQPPSSPEAGKSADKKKSKKDRSSEESTHSQRKQAGRQKQSGGGRKGKGSSG